MSCTPLVQRNRSAGIQFRAFPSQVSEVMTKRCPISVVQIILANIKMLISLTTWAHEKITRLTWETANSQEGKKLG